MTPPAPSGARGRPRAALGVLLGAVLAVLAGLVAAPPAMALDRAEAPVVVIGVGGLAWTDVTPATPALWSLAQDAVGSLVVRSVRSSTCPADGWLALSTGTRTADLPGPCRLLTEPVDGVVPGWADYQAAAAQENFDARLGLFGDALRTSGTAVATIGPGAAVAVADTSGRVSDHLDREAAGVALATQVVDALTETDLLVIDAGSIRGADRSLQGSATEHHTAQLGVVERRLSSVLDGIGASGVEPVLLLAGLADAGTTPGLRVLAASGGDFGPGLMTSSSTRQDGYVLGTDLQATVAALLGITEAIPSGVTIGAPVSVDAHAGTAEERIGAVLDQELHAQAVRPLVPRFYLILVVLNLALFAAVAVGLKRPAANRISGFFEKRFTSSTDHGVLRALVSHPDRVLRLLRIAALSIGALPVASFLTNLVPWWRNTPASLALTVYTALWVAAIVTVALAGPWRRRVLGPATVVAAVTAVVLTVDIATGARLQISAVMGVPTLVAGRFYGMNNTAFSLFTVSSILVTIAITNALVRRGRRLLAAAATVVVGAFAALVDGAPSLGADFGGPPALLAAYGILALMAAGIRLTWRRILAVLLVAGAATAAFAFLDWLRPPDERTHLGRFLQTVLDGGLWPVVVRKADQNLAILFGNRPLTILAICGVLTVIFVLLRPVRGAITSPGGGQFDWLSSGTPISRMGAEAPMLQPGLVAIGVALGIGLLVNDSGIAIPAIGVSVTVPLLIAACATWMIGLRPGADPSYSAGSAVVTSSREASPR